MMKGLIRLYKDIKGFDGQYKVDENGNVLSFKQDKINGKLLKQAMGTSGYYYVTLCDGESNNKKHSIHRLVANAFIENFDHKREVNHIDEIKTNNHFSNLEWVTPKENCNHGTRIKRVVNNINYNSVSEKNSKPILQLDKNNNFIRNWNSIKECMQETGFNNSNIVKCCRGKAKTSYGFKWSYA